jgi:glucose-6-phosphate 1-epimerase
MPAATFTEVLGQPAIALQTPDGARATVLLHGAHVVSWQPAGRGEMLYLSPRAVAGEGRAVRGGIPVIFPQFERRGPLPRHGFARNRAWRLLDSTRPGLATFQLQSSEQTLAIWPHAFEAELTVSIEGAQLDVELAVANTGSEPFSFTAALHTYLRCADIHAVRLTGLSGTPYEDSVAGGQHRQEIEPLSIVGEIDRIYRGLHQPLALTGAPHRLAISSEGWPDAVLWNPGAVKAAALDDLPADGWRDMLCVEAARIAEPVLLAAGEDWAGRQTLQAG